MACYAASEDERVLLFAQEFSVNNEMAYILEEPLVIIYI